LGFSHPDKLQKELTSTQISEWEAYDKIDPIGEWRADYRMSVLASLVMNIAIKTHGKRGTKTTEFMDFFPIWDEEQRKQKEKGQTIAEMKNALQGIASHFKNKFKKGTHDTRPPASLRDKKK